jgi:unsaturated rhamnogalacturonyl hydrolase
MTSRRVLRSAVVGAIAVAAAGTVTAVVLPASAATTGYEAESATLSKATVATNHTGFTGSGFVDYQNTTGGFVEFTVNVATAGNVSLAFRYANGTTTARPLDIAVDGGTATSASFAGTGSWNTWKTVTTSATVTAGSHKVRATATSADGGPNLDSLSVTDGSTNPPPPPPPPPPPNGTDFAKGVADAQIARGPLTSWGYTQGLFSWGTYLVYQRTHDPKYLNYIKAYADRFVMADGSINNSFGSLDSMQSGNVLLALFKETGQTKYRTAATKIRNRLETFPRINGAWWHADTDSRKNQNWADGVFMALPFLVRYGQLVDDKKFGFDGRDAYAEAVQQLTLYYNRLRDPSNELLRHAYDGSPAGQKQSWANPTTGQAPEIWCRGEGWTFITMLDVLDTVPASTPGRDGIITMLQRVIPAMMKFQDPATGRWFQLVIRGSDSRNWTETSCSAMYTYVLSHAVEKGYVSDPTGAIKAAATKGFLGVQQRISPSFSVSEICIGTNVAGTAQAYFDRPRATNDLHGLGSVVIMAEQLQRTG